MTYYLASSVRGKGLRAYAEAHGWDYSELIQAFDDHRMSVSMLKKKFKRKDGRKYSSQWMYFLKEIYREEKAAGVVK